MYLGCAGLLLLCISTVRSYESYQNSIPNGNKVPHPCKQNFIWWGVGHNNAQGGGSRNPFGIDFEKNGKSWANICRMDSDKDGKTNGEELNDPNCTWRPGQAHPSATGITHPGVCTPLNSVACQQVNNVADICKEVEYKCEATKAAGVRQQKIQITRTSLPAKETLYYCQTYDLPTDRDYHLIGSKPEIVNKQVAHHMIAYGCTDSTYGNTIAAKYRSPRACDMDVNSACPELLGGWSVGEAGECLPNEYGFRFGRTGVKKVILQIHWNNPEKSAQHTDSSGMTLFYTPNLRPNDGGVFTLGQQYLKIPAGRSEHVATATCPSQCTQDLGRSVTLVGGSLHMHYLGRGGTLSIKKKGSSTPIVLMNQKDYKYDSPKNFDFKKTRFDPGDELTMTCVFNSMGKSKTTYYGDATQEEMCFVFFSYYPKNKFTSCVQFRDLDTCDMAKTIKNGCNFTKFWTTTQTYLDFDSINKACGSSQCDEKCLNQVTKIKQGPCWQGTNGLYVEGVLPSIIRTQDFGSQVSSKLKMCSNTAAGGPVTATLLIFIITFVISAF